MPKVTWQRTKI